MTSYIYICFPQSFCFSKPKTMMMMKMKGLMIICMVEQTQMFPLTFGLLQGIICHIERLKGWTWSPELLEWPKQEGGERGGGGAAGAHLTGGPSDPSSYHVLGPLTWPTQTNKFLPKNLHTKKCFQNIFDTCLKEPVFYPKKTVLILTSKNNFPNNEFHILVCKTSF